MAVTQKDIAQKLGISQQVVASALNGRGSRMSEETRCRILEEANRLGYRPNLAARALTTQRTQLIAVWTRNLSRPFYSHLMHHLEEQLRQSEYEMIVRVLPEEGTPSSWQAAQWPVDGILAIEVAQLASQYVKSSSGHVPVVCLGGYDSSVPELDCVWIDLYRGAYQAVEHLVAQGCERIAALIHTSGYEPGNLRYDGYTDAMRAAGRKPEYIAVPDITRAAAGLAVRTYTARHGHPDGLFCYNDDLAIGAFRTLRDSGKRIPEDIALVGCDGIEDTLYLEKPLTTIVTPLEAMCARSWDLLRHRMRDADREPHHEVLPPHLEIRASSQRDLASRLSDSSQA